MSDPTTTCRLAALIALPILVALGIGVCWFLANGGAWPRGEALDSALRPVIEQQSTDQSLVARAILESFQETRQNATKWSAIYWGFTFAAAALSALAGLILKFESILKNDGLKKDLAAVFSVSAAILITISTSGDFQRKWQANRIAAAELERSGYEFLENNGVNARSYLATVGQILLKRHMSIVGGTEQRKSAPDAKSGRPQK